MKKYNPRSPISKMHVEKRTGGDRELKPILAAVFVLTIGICAPAGAQEDKTKGLDVVSDTAITIIKKTNAFFQGNLEWTVPTNKDDYKKDYTINALGTRVPRSTLGKYDSGIR